MRPLQRDAQILPDRQSEEYARHLELDAHPAPDPQVRLQLRDVLALEEYRARRRRIGAQDQLEERALARAVRPDQAAQLALLDREVDTVDRAQAAEVLLEPARLQDRGHRSRSGRWKRDGLARGRDPLQSPRSRSFFQTVTNNPSGANSTTTSSMTPITISAYWLPLTVSGCEAMSGAQSRATSP